MSGPELPDPPKLDPSSFDVLLAAAGTAVLPDVKEESAPPVAAPPPLAFPGSFPPEAVEPKKPPVKSEKDDDGSDSDFDPTAEVTLPVPPATAPVGPLYASGIGKLPDGTRMVFNVSVTAVF